jgi:hypothetical protein
LYISIDISIYIVISYIMYRILIVLAIGYNNNKGYKAKDI